jgi:hypothetical protein
MAHNRQPAMSPGLLSSPQRRPSRGLHSSRSCSPCLDSSTPATGTHGGSFSSVFSPGPLRRRPVSEFLTPTGRQPAELSYYDRDDFSRRAPRDPELPGTLLRRLEGVGHDTSLQAFSLARKYGSSGPTGYSLPITKDTLVEALGDARMGREEAVAKFTELEKALRRAEIFADMMKTQYLYTCARSTTRRRRPAKRGQRATGVVRTMDVMDRRTPREGVGVSYSGEFVVDRVASSACDTF